MQAKIGERVGAILSGNDTEVRFFHMHLYMLHRGIN
jgi:hypothetical protein